MSSKTEGVTKDKTISPRQRLRLILAYLFVPIILFLCGGDLTWWQAWFYSLIFLVAGVGGRIWAEKRHPGITAERQNKESFQNAKAWDKVLAPLMAISLVFPMVIVAGLDHRFNWSIGFPLWLNLFGIVLIIIGYAFAAWALAENRFFASVMRIQTERGHVVCDTGPYRFVRHPGYAGSIIPLFGIALALDSIWTFIPAILASAITMVRTLLEDQALLEELSGYQEYAKSVRYRLLPWVY